MSDLSIRMKEYESNETGRKLTIFLPIYARIDGRAFSRFTSRMNRPYDERMCQIMIKTTKFLVKETNAAIGYTQSDEINLVFHDESQSNQMFFGGHIFKLTSVLAGLASSAFLMNYVKFFGFPEIIPSFDCRVINLPNKTEAANMILWREFDATRNAVVSAARTVATHEEVKYKDIPALQELLFQNGINFNDYPAYFKRGAFVKNAKVGKYISDEVYDKISDDKKPKSRIVERNHAIVLDMPPFSKIINREDVIFGKDFDSELSKIKLGISD